MKFSSVNPTLHDVGFLGFLIFLPLTLLVLYRTIVSVIATRRSETKHLYKLHFHGLLLLYSILELIYLINLWKQKDNYDEAYSATVVHHVALLANVAAFAIVYFSIAKLIFKANLSTVHITITVVMVVVCVMTLSYLIVLAVNPDCASKACIDFQSIALLLQGLGLLALSLSFFFLGVQISRRLYTTQSGFNWNEFLRFNNEIFRISIANIICTICYIMRVFFLLLLVATLTTNNPNLPDDVVGVVASNNLLWFLISKWIPFIIPTLILLYLMKPTAMRTPAAPQSGDITWTSNTKDQAVELSPSGGSGTIVLTTVVSKVIESEYYSDAYGRSSDLGEASMIGPLAGYRDVSVDFGPNMSVCSSAESFEGIRPSGISDVGFFRDEKC